MCSQNIEPQLVANKEDRICINLRRANIPPQMARTLQSALHCSTKSRVWYRFLNCMIFDDTLTQDHDVLTYQLCSTLVELSVCASQWPLCSLVPWPNQRCASHCVYICSAVFCVYKLTNHYYQYKEVTKTCHQFEFDLNPNRPYLLHNSRDNFRNSTTIFRTYMQVFILVRFRQIRCHLNGLDLNVSNMWMMFWCNKQCMHNKPLCWDKWISAMVMSRQQWWIG